MMLDCDFNLPIGAFEDAEFSLQETTLSPGSTIFLYTDGLTEAQNADKKQFGLKRTKDVLKFCIEQMLNAKDTVNKVTEQVHHFVKDAEQSDDLTMLVIRVRAAAIADPPVLGRAKRQGRAVIA